MSEGRPSADSDHRGLVFLMMVSAGFVLLAGQFGMGRLGLANVLPAPERAIAVMVMLLFFSPQYLRIRRSQGVSRERYMRSGQRALWLLFLYWALSALWSPMGRNLVDYLWDIFCMWGICLIVTWATQLDLTRAWRVFLGFAFWSGLLFSMAGLVGGDSGSRLAVFGGGPNVFARITGLGILAAFYLAGQWRLGGATLCAVIPMGVATVLSGSRGAMGGLTLALLLSIPALIRSVRPRLVLGSLVFCVAFYFAVEKFGDRVAEVFGNRIVRLTFEERYTSGRSDLYPSALSDFFERPLFGYGLHAWEFRHGQFFGFLYPHNMTLQVGAEGGIVGLGLVAAPAILALALGWRYRRDMAATISFSSFFLIYGAQQFSGDYYDSRGAWVYLIFGMAHSSILKSRAGAREKAEMRRR